MNQGLADRIRALDLDELRPIEALQILHELAARVTKTMRVAGIMSGTSLDGIDVAIIDITGSGYKAKINVLTSHSVPYPRKVREALLGISNANTHTSEISRLNFLLGELYAEAVEETAERGGIPLPTIRLIGCHGQTIYHEGQASAYLGKESRQHVTDW